MAINFTGAHFPPEVILMGVRWSVAYPLSTRHVEELMEERGVEVDHSTINRWVVKYSPLLEDALHRRKRPVWVSWRMDETYVKVKGQWRYLYRAVDKYGQTIDFLLTEHRDTEAALRFLKKAIRRNGLPETITIDGSDANEAAIKRYNEAHGTAIIIRQVKYLNNVVEQDHRAVKRVTRPMLGFKSFEAAQDTLVGIELMHMIKKRQMVVEEGDEGCTVAELFYSLAACSLPQIGATTPSRPLEQNLRQSRQPRTDDLLLHLHAAVVAQGTNMGLIELAHSAHLTYDRLAWASTCEFIPLSFCYDAPLTSQYSDRRHHPWPVYGSLTYGPARWSSWISPA